MTGLRRFVLLVVIGAALAAVVWLGGQDLVLTTTAEGMWVCVALTCEGGHYLVRRADRQRQRLLDKRETLRRLYGVQP